MSNEIMGQILPDSSLGYVISTYSENQKYKNFVEIGTWRGGGSTKCFFEGFKKRTDDFRFISIEANSEMYNSAINLWSDHLGDNFKILHGKIVEIENLFTADEILKEQDFHSDWINWLHQDLIAMSHCQNVVNQLPEKIDVTLLDGGEFSSFAEYEALKERTQVFILDDTKVLKNRRVRQELIVDPSWNCLIDRQDERNGYSVFSKG